MHEIHERTRMKTPFGMTGSSHSLVKIARCIQVVVSLSFFVAFVLFVGRAE